jgi:hypothetical protein
MTNQLRLSTMLALALLCGAFMPAHANVFTYSCNIVGQKQPLSVNEAKMTLRWLGKTYRLTMQPDCAKYGWHAEGNGTSFDFCTATQGVAGITQKPPPEGPTEIDCSQTNRSK